ncbi:MAG: hypothetical protein M1814_003525 [Vezdaea aestivalis]|nr:MAG: hypothetical protein M1814_003525 [Vezdaea aestivalis]
MAPRKGWIDKRNATKYTVVFRPQDDPLIHDTSASPMVFTHTAVPNARPDDTSSKNKIRTRQDFELDLHLSERGRTAASIRENEGEAAEHGVYFDDSEYDYMQHLKDVGDNEGSLTESENGQAGKGKGKARMKLEDALAATSLEDNDDKSSVSDMFDGSSTASQYRRQPTYQDQQDVPDNIAGFQPDMDPRLREVLEALDDEAYVDDGDELFTELSKDHNEISLEEFEDNTYDIDTEDTGWESDDTAKPEQEYKPPQIEQQKGEEGAEPNPNWLAQFQEFKKHSSTSKPWQPRQPEPPTSAVTGGSYLTGGRRKKRKGALTDPSNFSMTSSSLARTEGLKTLDARFDRLLEKEYMYDDDKEDGGKSVISGTNSIASSTTSEVPSNFDGLMDEFLSQYSTTGKGRRQRVRRGATQTGMEQLDEVRRELGPARRKIVGEK